MNSNNECTGLDNIAAENGDLYIWVCEVDKLTSVPKILVNAKKIERLTQLPLGSRVITNLEDDLTTILSREPLGDNTRKINVKIGHVSDTSILKSIKKERIFVMVIL